MFEVGEAKSWVSLVGGIIFIALGVFFILLTQEIIKLPIPSPGNVAMLILLAVASLVLIYDGFMGMGMHLGWDLFGLAIGLLTLAASVGLLLGQAGIIAFTLVFATLFFLEIALVLLGILILIGAFMF